MANNERLTKRVKKIEQWMAENEEMGGPRGYLDTMVALYNDAAGSQQQLRALNANFERLRAYSFEFIGEHELGEEWNEFLEEKDNAVQKQQTEEVSVQEEAESGEETIETPEENKKE